MDPFALPLLIYYIAIIAVFCAYGLHRYRQVWQLIRGGGIPPDPEPAGRFEDLPPVTIQLPMFNERRVAERIIRAACAIDYPRDRLEIQVLDDSTDESAEIARRACARLAEAGHDVRHLRRTNREGYKAGALAAGLQTARGTFIAMFDADFVPPPDILRKTIHHFTDDSVGMVQTRWAHLNRNDSILTRIQALCLDGHFVVEQTARASSGCWFNFNGTAGVWRRSCIDDAGGWQHDTLTEDTDLSYRAQIRHWQFRYLARVTCPAELPPTVGALMTQQHRWSKGLVQTAIKLLPGILLSRAPLAAKVEAWFHLTAPVPYAAIFFLTLLALPSFFVPLPASGITPETALGLGMVCLALGTCSACAFCLAGQIAQRRPIVPALLLLPALMAVGVGISLMNTRAIVEAILGRTGPFVRTPKFAGTRTSGTEQSESDPAARRGRRLPPGLGECGLGAVMIACIALTWTHPFALVGLPFLVLFGAGYLAIGVPQVLGFVRRGGWGARVVRPVASASASAS